MSADSDLEWVDRDAGPSADQISAAKLHVLHLDPIKAKLGDRWERLSSLVHKLFEKTLNQTQGPRDHFLLVDELSYVVTFHNLSLEEAGLACASVAQKVCELLFGADIDDIAVRSLVGPVSAALLSGRLGDAARISEILERRGGEIIVTPKSIDPGWRAQGQGLGQAGGVWQPSGWIRKAHRLVADAGITPGFFPVWDIKNRKSASLYCSAWSGVERSRVSVRRALFGAAESQLVDTEIAMLNATAEYAHRMHTAQKVCAVGVGVSYETLSGFHSRIHYIGALKALQTVPTSPLLLRVERVPPGTPLGRLAEIVAMLAIPNVRVTVEFQSLRALPELDIRLGAAGLGASLKNFDGGNLAAAVQKLARRAADQRAFAFLHDIDTDEMLAIATQNGIRFGSGNAIDRARCYSGEEPVPDLPLQL
ncbi:MAG TPA: hypothetical protein VHY57_09700 [Rhizomicrobium sp.]|jgi:hypothetical protein|nr:hypothetical protein [Rhizomicrobium sp.]